MHKNENRERERLAAVAALLLRCLKNRLRIVQNGKTIKT